MLSTVQQIVNFTFYNFQACKFCENDIKANFARICKFLIEKFSFLASIVRMTVWLVSFFNNFKQGSILRYQNGEICKNEIKSSVFNWKMKKMVKFRKLKNMGKWEREWQFAKQRSRKRKKFIIFLFNLCLHSLTLTV